MATTDKTGIQASITAGIRTGASDTTAAELRAILNEILDSYTNVVDGGNVYQNPVGYNYLPVTLGATSFINRSYADTRYQPIGTGNSLGLIQIIDLEGFFFTDLATASAYIRTMWVTPPVITNESFDSGVYYFTVPSGTIIEGYFLTDTVGGLPNNASVIDLLGLLVEFQSGANFVLNNGSHVLRNCTFTDSDFYQFTGNVLIKNIVDIFTTLGNSFAEFSTGKFIIEGNIGYLETAQYTPFFRNSTATIFVNAAKYTSNAGDIHGDLQSAISNGCNVFFDGIDKENLSNKQTNLTPSATKYPTVNAVNVGLATKLNKARTIAFSHSTLNPADATTYYFGSNIVANAVSTTSTALRRAYSPLTGFVYAVMINVQVSSTLGTSEGVTFTLNNVTQGTSVVLSTAIVYSIISSGVMVELGTPFAVNANDALEIKIDTPTFVTNPISVINLVTLYLGTRS